MAANSENRNNSIIKLYLLDDQNSWKDAGKGYLHIQKLWNSQTELEEDTIEILLCETSEKAEISTEKLELLKKNIPKDLKEAYLLRSAVKKENTYEKQTNKVITCIDKDLNEEIAISFLDTFACNETWRLICNAIGKNPHQDQVIETKDLECLVLPSLINLDSIVSELQTKIDWMVKAMLEKPEFLKKLKEVFETLEDLDQQEDLKKIFQIFKMLVFSNDIILIEFLMNDFFYETVFGVFEYDEENTGFRKQFHRSYLKNETKMHVFEDFLSKEIEKKVRINFRISYLRDTVLASKIDESLLTTLNTMIYYNNFEIIYYILAEKSKLNHLIETFSLNKLEEKVNFFSEFFSILKLLQGSNDLKLLLNELISNTSFLLQNIKSFILIENSSSFRSKILENMLFLAQSNPEKFMLFFLTQKKEIKEFLQALRECFKQFEDEGLVIQSCEFIIYLLDPLHDKKIEICEVIFEEFLSLSLDFLTATTSNSAQYLIEIIIFCVKSHGFRIRQFLIQNKVLTQCLKMIKSKKKNVIITIIKFFKAVLTSNDEILLRYVHTNGFIMDISELLFERKGIFNSGNLIFSSCLELFELIYKQNLKKFIKSICDNDNLKQKIREKPYLSKYFEKIFQRCEQYKEDDPFSQLKPNNNNTNNGDNIESELNEKKNLEELAYFESDEPNNINIVNNERNEIVIFNSEELKQKKENLILLQNKMTCKRKLEEPKEQGLIFKKVHDESKKIVNLNLSTKIDIVFQEKYN